MDKSRIRKVAMHRFIKSNSYLRSKKISQQLYNLVKFYGAKKILLYIPLKNEVNVKGLIYKLKRENCKVFVPFMQDISFKMVKYSLPLRKKKFNIYEPLNKNKTKDKVDMAIVPIIGIDTDFKRVGFGKGMYDRFFDSLNYKPKIIFTQLDLVAVNCVVTNHFDIKADTLVTYKMVCDRRRNVRNISRIRCVSSSRLLNCKKN